jgi:putative ABC transport system ATP-binding protein
MNNDIVVAENLNKVYKMGRIEVAAVNGISLRVRRGEFLAVQGPSGSGKTTLLNLIGALDRPTSGKIIVDGIETTKISERKLFQIRRQKIGFIFQIYYLIPTLSAMQNVLIPVLPVGIRRKDRERAEQVLDLVGLKDRKAHKPGELSGGEQQRVAVARALVTNPALILADEPTGNLDTKTSAGIVELMHRLNREQGTTFLVVTHDSGIAGGADRVVYLKDGELFAADEMRGESAGSSL